MAVRSKKGQAEPVRDSVVSAGLKHLTLYLTHPAQPFPILTSTLCLFLSALAQHPPPLPPSLSLFLFQDFVFAMRQSRHYFHCLPLLWQHPLRFEGHWDFKGDRQFYTTGEVHLFLVSQCNLQRGKEGRWRPTKNPTWTSLLLSSSSML